MGISMLQDFFDMVLLLRDNHMGQCSVNNVDLMPHDKIWQIIFVDLKRNPITNIPTFIHQWQYDSDLYNSQLGHHIDELCEYGYLIRHGPGYRQYRVEDAVKEKWGERYNKLSQGDKDVLSAVAQRVNKRFATKDYQEY
ncbi:MAG: hypothetical protein Q8P11_01220 [bacterium]|nr:hypothetical protein [bacterium]